MIKNKKIEESVLVFFFFSILVVFIGLNTEGFNYDKIWLVHMLQKIANGELIYKDINAITGPIFFLMGGGIFKIFGSTFLTYEIFSGIMYGLFSVIVYNLTKYIGSSKNKYLKIITLVFLFENASMISVVNYNIFCLIFVLTAMYFEIKKIRNNNKEKYDLYIGIFLALAFLSKQTIGAVAVIATGLVSLIYGILIKKTNPIKEILIKAIGFLSIISVAILLMLAFGNFSDYIDLCFGSILEFGENNISMTSGTPYFAAMIAILIAGIMILKLNKSDKELLIINLYAVATMFFMAPIANSYHIYMGLIINYFILIKILNILAEYKKHDTLKLISTIFIVLLHTGPYFSMQASDISNTETVVTIFDLACIIYNMIFLCVIGYEIIKERQEFLKKKFYILISVFIIILACNHFYTIKKEDIPQGLEIYSKHGFNSEELYRISNVIDYIKEKESEGHRVMVISSDASLYMYPLNRNNNKFDLFLYGNLGYKGTERMISQMGEWENTIILRNDEIFWQEPKEIDEYLEDNCEKIGQIEDLKVYYQK